MPKPCQFILCLIAAIMSGSLLAPTATAQTQPGQPREPQRLPEGTQALRDLPYVEEGSKAQRLDLYLPANADHPLPLIIWIHGGAWLGGNKAQCPARPFLAQGYAVASVEYRLSPEAAFPAQIYDCKAAVRFLRANAKKYNLNSDRFGAWGSSAGGHLVALLGTSGDVKELEGPTGNLDQSSKVQCVCDWFGPTDFTTIAAQSGPEIRMRHDTADSPESKLIGGTPADNPDKAKAVSPVTYVTKDAPPFLIMHGDKDPLIPLAQSQELDAALRKAGVDTTLFVVKGGGHGFGGPEIMKQVRDFFDKHLKAAPP